MMEAINVICGDAVMEYDATGRVPVPGGNHHPGIAPHNNYAAAGGEWLAIAAETESAWLALVDHVGDVRLKDSKFSTLAGRKQHEGELDELLGQWVAGQDAARAERVLGGLGITAARVKPFYDIYHLPDTDFTDTGFVSQVDHPEAGSTWLPGRPWRFSTGPATPIRPAPCVGQHSHEILVDELGISEAEYASLVAAGVTGTLDDLRD